MTGKKTDATREAMLAFLSEIEERTDVPFDLKQKALNLSVRCKEMGRRGRGSTLALLEQVRLYRFVNDQRANGQSLSKAAEIAAETFPLDKRRIEQIYQSFETILDALIEQPTSE